MLLKKTNLGDYVDHIYPTKLEIYNKKKTHLYSLVLLIPCPTPIN